MEQTHDNTWERTVARLAQRYEYPATPDVAAAVRRPTADRRPRQAKSGGQWSAVSGRLAWALLVIALVLAGLLAVPQTRAAVLSLVARIGAISIFVDEAAPTATPFPAPGEESGLIGPPPTALPPTRPIRAISHSLELYQLGDSTTLADARRLASFPLSIPGLLGEPDEVYVHGDTGVPAVSLVWRDPDGSYLSLTEIGISEFAQKLLPDRGVKYRRLGDIPAVWIESPHTLELLGVSHQDLLQIDSNVLIWTDGEVTYRLEGDLTEEEMVAIAESMPE